MATVGGKMCLDMGHLDGCAHETKRKSPGSMNEFFRNKGTEKPMGARSLGRWEAISGYPPEAMISNSLSTFIRELPSSIRSQQVKSNPGEFLLQYED